MHPELYLHGLSKGDFELALRGLLGDGAPLSASSIERLRAKWQLDYDAWRTRPLHDREPVYLWADGVWVKASLEKEKAALLVVVAAYRDGRKEVLAVEAGHRESAPTATKSKEVDADFFTGSVPTTTAGVHIDNNTAANWCTALSTAVWASHTATPGQANTCN